MGLASRVYDSRRLVVACLKAEWSGLLEALDQHDFHFAAHVAVNDSARRGVTRLVRHGESGAWAAPSQPLCARLERRIARSGRDRPQATYSGLPLGETEFVQDLEKDAGRRLTPGRVGRPPRQRAAGA